MRFFGGKLAPRAAAETASTSMLVSVQLRIGSGPTRSSPARDPHSTHRGWAERAESVAGDDQRQGTDIAVAYVDLRDREAGPGVRVRIDHGGLLELRHPALERGEPTGEIRQRNSLRAGRGRADQAKRQRGEDVNPSSVVVSSSLFVFASGRLLLDAVGRVVDGEGVGGVSIAYDAAPTSVVLGSRAAVDDADLVLAPGVSAGTHGRDLIGRAGGLVGAPTVAVADVLRELPVAVEKRRRGPFRALIPDTALSADPAHRPSLALLALRADRQPGRPLSLLQRPKPRSYRQARSGQRRRDRLPRAWRGGAAPLLAPDRDGDLLRRPVQPAELDPVSGLRDTLNPKALPVRRSRAGSATDRGRVRRESAAVRPARRLQRGHHAGRGNQVAAGASRAVTVILTTAPGSGRVTELCLQMFGMVGAPRLELGTSCV